MYYKQSSFVLGGFTVDEMVNLGWTKQEMEYYYIYTHTYMYANQLCHKKI